MFEVQLQFSLVSEAKSQELDSIPDIHWHLISSRKRDQHGRIPSARFNQSYSPHLQDDKSLKKMSLLQLPTPPKFNMEPEHHPLGKGTTSSKPWFWGPRLLLPEFPRSSVAPSHQVPPASSGIASITHHLMDVTRLVNQWHLHLLNPWKTNMIGWKIPMFNRKYNDSFMVDFPASHVSFFGGVPGCWKVSSCLKKQVLFSCQHIWNLPTSFGVNNQTIKPPLKPHITHALFGVGQLIQSIGPPASCIVPKEPRDVIRRLSLTMQKIKSY